LKADVQQCLVVSSTGEAGLLRGLADVTHQVVESPHKIGFGTSRRAHFVRTELRPKDSQRWLALVACPAAQKDPTRLPSKITAASARRELTIATMTMSR
jgi:hypothetical protein